MWERTIESLRTATSRVKKLLHHQPSKQKRPITQRSVSRASSSSASTAVSFVSSIASTGESVVDKQQQSGWGWNWESDWTYADEIAPPFPVSLDTPRRRSNTMPSTLPSITITPPEPKRPLGRSNTHSIRRKPPPKLDPTPTRTLSRPRLQCE
ncbi:uncharacterized protein PSANT_06575 [Moesziomyces antarcticus]|uniref:Uncharacterized protein n=1 Tax=Pseudozyma antarctica TaxID=84753 RepID=A0A5C3FWY7_PSEA2|nr:uncharacterized protein PSANT_06575 [Moesziomyces antarcticus]